MVVVQFEELAAGAKKFPDEFYEPIMNLTFDFSPSAIMASQSVSSNAIGFSHKT